MDEDIDFSTIYIFQVMKMIKTKMEDLLLLHCLENISFKQLLKYYKNRNLDYDIIIRLAPIIIKKKESIGDSYEIRVQKEENFIEKYHSKDTITVKE